MYDSVSTAFRNATRALPGDTLWLDQPSLLFPHDWTLYQSGGQVALLHGKETIPGGEHFSVIPILPAGWPDERRYTPSLYNVPYWGGEVRLKSLDTLLFLLAQGRPLPEALDYAVDVDMGRAGEPYPDPGLDRGDEGAPYKPEAPTILAEPEIEPDLEPEPILAKGGGDVQDYLWTIWFEGRGGVQKADLTCTRELAGKVWDTLSHEVPRMLSARP